MEYDKEPTEAGRMLAKAITLAAQKHEGQFDKSGRPYILHPLRVMQVQATDEARIAGILHDIVEDTDVTLEQLKEMGFPQMSLDAIDLLTHRKGQQTYREYVYKIRDSGNKIALFVKLGDLADNSRADRMVDLSPDNRKFLKERYLKAFGWLRAPKKEQAA